MFLFLQKRDDIQAVRGRGLPMSRKSEGNVDWKPKEENATKQGAKSLGFPLLLLCYGGVEKAGERPVTPFHSPNPSLVFSSSQNRNKMPFTHHMNKVNSYQCTNILRVTRPDGRWLEMGHAHQPHPSPAQYQHLLSNMEPAGLASLRVVRMMVGRSQHLC